MKSHKQHFCKTTSRCNPLSVIVITKNCSHTIESCLLSVKALSNEIIVLDSGSTDQTVDICRRHTDQVFATDWPGFGLQKQRALNKATNEWVLSIDADEVLTEDCVAEIQTALASNAFDAYRIHRHMIFAGKKVRHSGCSDKPLRLFKRSLARFSDDVVHESVITSGKIGIIKSPMLHYSYASIGDWIAKMNLYSELAQQKLTDKKYSVKRAILSAGLSFFKMYVLKKGFLDGRLGLVAAINASVACYYKYLKITLDQEFNKVSLCPSGSKKSP